MRVLGRMKKEMISMGKWKRIGIFLLVMMLYGQSLYPIHGETGYGLKIVIENPDNGSNTKFGGSVAINDGYVYIGAEDSKIEDLIQAGKVYLFDLDGEYLTSIESEKPVQQDKFGWAIFTGYDKLIVTENERSQIGKVRGQSYLYQKDGSFIKVINSPLNDTAALFGHTIAILSDKFIVGAPWAFTEHGAAAGRLHVFDESGNLLDTRFSPNPTAGGGYGFRIVSDGDLVVVTEMHATGTRERSLNKGIVYIYDSNWELLHTINSSNTERDNFGYSLALNEDYIFIGDKYSTVEGVERAGKVFIYNRDGQMVDSIEPSNPVAGAHFGESIAVYNDIIVIGEPWSDEQAVDAGKAYVYQIDGTLLTDLMSPEPTNRGYFGESVAIYGENIVVGEYGADRAYVFAKGATGVVETETEETSTEETTTTEEKPEQGIPGFPLPVLLLSIAMTSLYLMSRQKNNYVFHWG